MSESETKPASDEQKAGCVWQPKQVGQMSADELGAFIKAMEAGHKSKLRHLKALLKAQRVMEVMLSSAGAALGGAALAGGWLATGWWLGRRFDREKERAASPKP
jgi:hypothetical protein